VAVLMLALVTVLGNIGDAQTGIWARIRDTMG
jgi:hypothetical protein